MGGLSGLLALPEERARRVPVLRARAMRGSRSGTPLHPGHVSQQGLHDDESPRRGGRLVLRHLHAPSGPNRATRTRMMQETTAPPTSGGIETWTDASEPKRRG